MTEMQRSGEMPAEPWRRRRGADRPAAHQMVTGLVIMGIGVALLLGRIGLFYVNVWRLWPLLLVGLGLARLSSPRPDGSRHGGGLLLVGVWLLLNELRIWNAADSWPIFVVAFGVKILWNALRASTSASAQVE